MFWNSSSKANCLWNCDNFYQFITFVTIGTKKKKNCNKDNKTMRVTKSLFATLITVVGILLPGSFKALAQESFGGTPPSFAATTSLLRSGELTPNVVRVRPDFNPEDAISTNTWAVTSSSDGITTKPLQIGRVIDQKIDFLKEARKSTVNGRTIYTLRIESKGAKRMVLYYDDFFIPEGSGELFIYTPDRVNVLGSYTYATHPEHGAFANEPLPGDVVIMEFAPYLTAGEEQLPSIKLSGVGYIFRGVGANHLRGQQDSGEDQSDPSCQIEINCSEGNEWQVQKAAVTQMMMKIGQGIMLCSGTLINNTAQDFKPYIISAAHCIGSPKVSQSDLNAWMFTFHFEKPGCSKAGIAVTRGRTAVGCQLRSFIDINGKSDGLLLELNKEVPKAFRVFYSGWDRSAKIPDSAVGIHHPSGDSKKISVCNGNIRITQWKEASGSLGAVNAHFGFGYDKGDTEGGSSGSPLFNQNHLLVGTLTGGAPGCGIYDAYGRFNNHWDRFKQSGNKLSSMDIYLDPINKGSETQQGTWRDDLRPLNPVTDLKVTLSEDAKTVNVTWNPVSTEQLPSHWSVKYRIFRNGLYLDGKDVTTGNSYSESIADAQSNTNGNGHVIYAVQARYMYGGDKIPDDGYNKGYDYVFGDADKVQMGAYLGDVKREMPAKVTAVSGGVDVSWKKPGNLQEISLFGYPSNLTPKKLTYPSISSRDIGKPDRIQLYSKFRADEMVNYDNSSVYISAISVIPTGKVSDLRVSIINGNPGTPYEENIKIPNDWKDGEWVTTELRKPYKVKPLQYLLAGISYNNQPSYPTKICYLEGTTDEISEYRGIIIRIAPVGYEPMLVYPSQIGVSASGYLAIRLTLSQSAVKYANDEEKSIFVRSNTAVPFPVIKGYIIKKNGETLKEVNKDTNFITDKTGSADDKYTVTVLYETPTGNEAPELAPSVAPSVYPTQLAGDGILNIVNAERVENVAVYSVDGKKLLAIDHPDARIDLTDLAEGSYLVVLTTENGSITERIFR